MKIADRTPFRTESGAIDFMGRVQGTLKYGLSWYARLQAQDAVIAIMEKVLGPNFVLLRNVTLPDTDIDLPLVLIGPPGLYLVNVVHERGVYRARDDEWGTIAGDKLVPAGINQLQRTVKLGKVLQVYLDRAGFKGATIVEPILMAADPGMHIESVRPAARIVMSDALERFAISMNQARPVLSADIIAGIAQTVVNGPVKKDAPAAVSAAATVTAAPVSGGRDTTDTLFDPSQQRAAGSSFSADELGFSFDDQGQKPSQPQRPANQQQPAPAGNSGGQTGDFRNNEFGDLDLRNAVFQDDEPQSGDGRGFEPQDTPTLYNFSESADEQSPVQAKSAIKPVTTSGKGKKVLGMTTTQLMILGGILAAWLCIMVVFAAIIFLNA